MLNNISLNNASAKNLYQIQRNSTTNIAKSINQKHISFGSNPLDIDINKEIADWFSNCMEKAIELQKNKNLPITIDPEKIQYNKLIKKAQKGEHKALNSDEIKKLIEESRTDIFSGNSVKYNFWDYPQFYRHVSKEEVENLLNGSIILPQNSPSVRVDVTNNINYWTRPYIVKFKLKDNLNPLLANDCEKRKIPHIEIKNMQTAEHWLLGGYTLDDVESIMKRLKNGSLKKINLNQHLEKKSIVSTFLDKLKIFKILFR